MNLTGQELIDKGIITGEILPENIAQCGVDLNVIEVEQVVGKGTIPKTGKTVLAERKKIFPVKGYDANQNPEIEHFELSPGVYDFTFLQGCKVPKNQRLDIVQRSSCSRNGLFIRSAVFDPGFETEHIGTMIQVMQNIRIEKGARVAQIVAIASNEVNNLYDGQWQGDKQRKD